MRMQASKARGFSLVELMVGLVIGMIAVIVVMQVFALSEGSKRATTGGDDAQTNGAIALTMLQRDIKQAGYGLSNFAVIGCNVRLPAPATWTVAAMGPVTINPAGIAPPGGQDANTDVVMVAYGNNPGSSEGDRIVSQPPATPPDTIYAVATSASFKAGDNVIALPPTTPRPNPCNATMEAVTAVAAPNVTVGSGVAGVVNGTLFNLGPHPVVRVYAIRGGALTMCDYMANDCSQGSANWVAIGDNIVSLRAQYGQDTTVPMDAVVDEWNQNLPVGTDACGWAKISALRLVLVARSAQLEHENVSTAAPAWSGDTTTPPVSIELAHLPRWQQYRYKTFETTVPLRNMAWQAVQPSC